MNYKNILFVFFILLNYFSINAYAQEDTKNTKNNLSVCINFASKTLGGLLHTIKTYTEYYIPQKYHKLNDEQQNDTKLNQLSQIDTQSCSIQRDGTSSGAIPPIIRNSENLVKIKGINIPIYEQILKDIPRDKISIIDQDKEITPLRTGQKDSQLVCDYFNTIKTALIQKNPQVHTKQLDYIIHNALSSRTQTFEKESLDFIFEKLGGQYRQDGSPNIIIAKDRQSFIYINADTIKASTFTNFIVGTGEGQAPVGEITDVFIIKRNMEFQIQQTSINNETLTYYRNKQSTNHPN
jgi:hypothetical protein